MKRSIIKYGKNLTNKVEVIALSKSDLNQDNLDDLKLYFKNKESLIYEFPYYENNRNY